MDLGDNFSIVMSFQAHALDGWPGTNETATAWQTEAAAIDLDAASGIHVEIDETGEKMFGLQRNAAFFHVNRVVAERRERTRTQRIVRLFEHDEAGKFLFQFVRHPEKKRLRTRRRFFTARDVERQEEGRGMPLAQRMSKGILSPVPGFQDFKRELF